MLAQVLFVAAVLVITMALWRSRETARGKAWKRIVLVLFALFVVLAILFPDLTTDAANLIGIGRGTDLLSYLTAFVVLIMALLVHLRFHRLDQRLAIVTRELALAEWDRQALREGPDQRDET